MRLHIRRSVHRVNDEIQFHVRCSALSLTAEEQQAYASFGAGPLQRAIDPEDRAGASIARLRTPEGITKAFDDVNSAIEFVALIKAACYATVDEWEAARSFAGDESCDTSADEGDDGDVS